ncbi:unnamed protein product [Mytilus edulis]|uniref:Uncharacterized protein n=1 Tax=Mytilus edulis TaxID=6550 RepID=A0A8S3TU64_MYTED|nr:unnamed protein product [Mytilus edulis]
MESKVKDAQSEFKCSIDNIPTGGSMLKLAAGEALITGIRGIFSFGGLFRNAATKIKTVFQPEFSIEHDEAYYDKELSCSVSVTGEKEKHGLSALDLKSITDGTLRYLKPSLEGCRDNVNREVLSGMPGRRASAICNEGISICSEVQQAVKDINFRNQPASVSKFVARVKKLQGETIALDAEASRAQRQKPIRQ